MAKLYDELDAKLIEFINKQKVFFVASAPLSGDGHVNISPKGYDSLVVVNSTSVAWLDMGGSGIETMAHVRENARMTLMFCAFDGPASILRLYGKADVVQFDDPDFEHWLEKFPAFEKARNIFVLSIDRIADSCGWGVPYMDFDRERDQLRRYHANPQRDLANWHDRFRSNNATSIDGLPGINSKKPQK
ncbi:pyridoxamine 5'-phosphate oxidase family protein [Oceanicaulis sp. AH-315-P02]|nr:pyridoxamine 5'-phosphate oxidase family protein [Robiginitomaculum sp.]MBN4047730.1 pyridoxamine 5'-phosphate oxidase family protein [Oceanicaulis sp. AH-315-P02]